MENKQLEIPESTYERKSEQTSWIVTIIFHACVMLLLVFITCSPGVEPEQLTQIEWGGGGIPGLDQPIGETPKGVVDGGDRNATKPQPTTQPKSDPTPTTQPTQQKPTNRQSPNTVPTNQQKPKTQTQPKESTPSETKETTDNSNVGTNNSSSAQGTPDGTNDKPAGGAGGPGVGSFSGGGIGRSWITSPQAAASGAQSQDRGTVTLRFVVKADGTVTNITKVGGTSSSLFSMARSLLSRARASREEPGTPDVVGTITFTVK